MNLIDKWEKKFGWFAVPNLMRYVVIINVVGAMIYLISPNFYFEYLSLDFYRIFHGEVWRLFTFVVSPYTYMSGGGGSAVTSIFWFALWAFVYYSIGSNLERIWGSFRFTLFYIGGAVFVIVITLLWYLFNLILAPGYGAEIGFMCGMRASLDYLNQSLFLAFAMVFPDAQFLVFFVIPVRAKWLCLVYILLDGFIVIQSLVGGDFFTVALVLGSLLNIVIFFLFSRGRPGVKGMYRQKKRSVEYKKKVQRATTDGPMHRCAICGRTEKDAPHLDFRYCSKCEGSYEYCSDHLFTHEHVHK